jgi:UDP-N-acetylglucosamine--N-acetylmuramyl-(pentapeptide) pyrophosphoryl-undecaprenol N-acetylglucosamine transferase
MALRILITGGGTGGHVFPAIAIADAVRRLRPDAEVLFVGALGKMEMERVPKAGYRIEGLPVAGFHRQLTLENAWRNLGFPFRLLASLSKARGIVRDFRPDVAVGTGGYASGPVMRAAQARGIPTLIQEQNSYAGVTNRLLARRARTICVAYDGMEQYFPLGRVVLTGNPVRASFDGLEQKRAEAIAHFALDPGKKTLAVIGGSLGARTLNNAIRDNVALLADRSDTVQVLWQCGRFYEAEFSQSQSARLANVKLLPFVDRMDLLYAASDVVISRAGALSISELCLVGKAAVLVPSPNVAEDHQTKNARALADKGAARLVPDAAAGERMLPEALYLLDHPAQSFALSEAIRQLAHPRAAESIALEVIALAENRTAVKPETQTAKPEEL